MAGQDGSFEEVFGFRPPTPEEAQGAADDLSFKMSTDGSATGTLAFFGVVPLREVSGEYMTVMAQQFANEEGIDRGLAFEIIQAGFIGALELMAAVRLRVDE